MTPTVKAFPFEADKPAKVTVERVGRLTTLLNAAGYRCALFASDFKPGTFIITLDRDNGYSVAWQKLGGLREVSA
ncbi:MAG TPA: hypothetical protein VL357_12835 [Rariglobus sp.]|jgi:hypothetical protein|nr:hypothetical protein [Rariglobus sp.]